MTSMLDLTRENHDNLIHSGRADNTIRVRARLNLDFSSDGEKGIFFEDYGNSNTWKSCLS